MKIKFFLLLLSITACNEDTIELANTCEVENPAEELPWLKTAIDDFMETDISHNYVEQATYQENTIFIFLSCCPACFFIPRVYDCQGNRLQNVPIDLEAIPQEKRKIIAKGEDFACNTR